MIARRQSVAIKFALLAQVLTLGFAAAADTLLTEGVNGVMSPEGTRIAFQRTYDNAVKLGLYYLADGRVEWVEDCDTCAAFPHWTSDGALLYSFGDRAHTAYENWKGGLQEGYGLRIWQNGVKRDLLPRARGSDVSPSLAPDGRTLWFCSNRALQIYGTNTFDRNPSDFIGNRLCRMDIDDPTSARRVYQGPDFSSTIGRCFSQPDVSPCGRVLAWAQVDSFTTGTWGIRLARPEDPADNTQVTPPLMIAFAPNWSPDGTNLVFTGCGIQDDGWYAYILNTRMQWMRRICPAENATFTADGRGLVYDRGGKLWLRELQASEWPTAADRIVDRGDGYHPWAEPAQTRLTIVGEDIHTNLTQDSRCAFSADTNLFVRMRAIWNGATNTTQVLLRGKYGSSSMGLQVYVTAKAKVHFSTRIANGNQALVESNETLESNRVYTITGVRTQNKLYISIDDGPTKATSDTAYTEGFISLADPLSLEVPSEWCLPGTVIKRVEIGTGWPTEMPWVPCSYLDGFDWGRVE